MTAVVNFRGIRFPFSVGSQGFPAAATNDDLIKQSLVQIVLTHPGERYMRPAFGCGAMSFVFEPIGGQLTAYVKETVMSSIAQYEPRVRVTRVDVAADAQNDAQVTVTIWYTVLSTGQGQSLALSLGTGP